MGGESHFVDVLQIAYQRVCFVVYAKTVYPKERRLAFVVTACAKVGCQSIRVIADETINLCAYAKGVVFIGQYPISLEVFQGNMSIGIVFYITASCQEAHGSKKGSNRE